MCGVTAKSERATGALATEQILQTAVARLGAPLLLRRVDVAQTRPLRHRILLPGKPYAVTVDPLDHAAEALHLGISSGGRLVAVGTLHQEDESGRTEVRAGRIRGMAVEPEFAGSGLGTAILAALTDHARAAEYRYLWCKARDSAITFYAARGFRTVGTAGISPLTGPYRIMVSEI